MDNQRLTRKYFLIYTILFLLVSACVFFPFAYGGKCLVGNGDGQSQYILQLEYMGRWLREAVRGFLHGDFTPRRFDFTIGMGDDINAVVRFHPLDFLSVFVPESGVEFLYQFLIFLRLYLAGLAFSVYVFAWKRINGTCKKNNGPDPYGAWAVLTGSMVYLFTGYTFSLGIVHPTYLSPLITLPLLLLGAEYMIGSSWHQAETIRTTLSSEGTCRRERHGFVLFSVMTAVSFISNYYFMYIASVAAVLYVFVRFFQIYQKNRVRSFLVLLLRFIAAYGIGFLISCITLLPTLKRYMGSYRSERLTAVNNLLVYADKRRYGAWLVNLISPLRASGNGTHLNYAVLVFPAIILLFAVRKEMEGRARHQERILLRVFLIIALGFLLIPAGGFLMAAMNNENNRWVFLIALLLGCVVSFSFPDFCALDRHQKRVLLLGCAVYDVAVAVSMFFTGFDLYPIAGALQLTVFTALILLTGRHWSRKKTEGVLLSVCLVSCIVNGVMTFAKPFGNLPRYYRDAGDTLSWYRNSVYANYLKIPETGQKGFYRVDGVFSGNSEDNAALLLGYQGIQMYNSVMNASEIDTLKKTGNTGLTTMLHIRHMDGRTVSEELAGVRYFMTDPASKAAIPYGYGPEPVYADGEVAIYENEHPLSFSYGMSRVMKMSEYEKLTEAEREFVCLDAAVLEDDAASSFDGEALTADEYQKAGIGLVPVSEARGKSGMKVREKADGSIVLKAAKKRSGYVFRANMREGYASYLLLEGVLPSVAAKLRVRSEDVQDTVSLLTENETYTMLRSNYLVNLGTADADTEKEITLSFSKKGKYQIGKLGIVQIPLEGYKEKVSAMCSGAMKQEQILEDAVTGVSECPKDSVLVFSIPYSEGWSAEVDGKNVPLFRTNGCWSGLVMQKGTHSVRLVYRTPMQMEGNICFLAGMLLLISGMIWQRKKQKAA